MKTECSDSKMSEPSLNTTCPLCQGEVGSGDIVSIGEKGADSINKACDDIHLKAGTGVHKSSRLSYTNKKLIDKHNRTKCIATPSRKRSVRISREPYDSTKDCLFCGNKVETSKVSFDYDHYSCVKTFTFVDQILTRCKTRSDAWSSSVQGRIEYFGRDLHAADCMYHHSCDVNFRTMRDVPMQHSTEPSASKRTKVGRPKNVYQQEAFLKMCAYFEDNDEEQYP